MVSYGAYIKTIIKKIMIHGLKEMMLSSFFTPLSVWFFFYLGAQTDFWYGWPLGFGILAYGIAYFVVHDIFIHQRFKMFRNASNWYAKGVRRAHKIHHKHIEKQDGECFGMLVVPFKYFKR